MSEKKFSVMDMLEDETSTHNTDISEEVTASAKTAGKKKKKKKKAWTPDAETLKSLPESNMTGGPIYNKEDIVVDGDKELVNMLDETATNGSSDALSRMDAKKNHFESAKARHGIKHLQVPEGPFTLKFHDAAASDNPATAAKYLDELMEDIIKNYPEFILEWLPGHGPEPVVSNHTNEQNIETSNNVIDPTTDPQIVNAVNDAIANPANDGGLVINVNKDDIDAIAFNRDNVEKIRKSHKIELNIIEGVDIPYSSIIENPDSSVVDGILGGYSRSINDEPAALPASGYRATFTGLSYAEVLDLSYSEEMNGIDGIRKKWSIAFNHVTNQSIGEWQSYIWYIDPISKQRVVVYDENDIPDIDGLDVHKMSKYDDFMSKTSYLDLDYILYKIVCATCMDTEIISVICNRTSDNGVLCDKSYEWVYSPRELLKTDSINPGLMEFMGSVIHADSAKAVTETYNDSMLNKQQSIKLPSCGYLVTFGHISAYDYVNSVYGVIEKYGNVENKNDVELSSTIAAVSLTSIKSFLVPQSDGRYARISDKDHMISVIKTLNNVDWQTINDIVDMMISPYQLKYSIDGAVCPHCKSRTTVSIKEISDLLFIVAQTMGNVEVSLKR